jgi:hypothetical protein
MIHQIIITDEEGMRVLEAVVDVKRRRVTQLSLEENYPAVVSAFVGLATLSAVIEGELVAEDARMKSPGVPVNDTLLRSCEANREQTVAEWAESQIFAFSAPEKVTPFPGLLIVDDLTEAKRIGKERLKPGLTNEDRATAMGLVQCRTEREACCAFCEHKWGYWLEIDAEGFVKRGVCNACLPAAFDKHMRDQADLDRLVEADDGRDGKKGSEGDAEKEGNA